jgi:hypothetical protein
LREVATGDIEARQHFEARYHLLVDTAGIVMLLLRQELSIYSKAYERPLRRRTEMEIGRPLRNGELHEGREKFGGIPTRLGKRGLYCRGVLGAAPCQSLYIVTNASVLPEIRFNYRFIDNVSRANRADRLYISYKVKRSAQFRRIIRDNAVESKRGSLSHER